MTSDMSLASLVLLLCSLIVLTDPTVFLAVTNACKGHYIKMKSPRRSLTLITNQLVTVITIAKTSYIDSCYRQHQTMGMQYRGDTSAQVSVCLPSIIELWFLLIISAAMTGRWYWKRWDWPMRLAAMRLAFNERKCNFTLRMKGFQIAKTGSSKGILTVDFVSHIL